MPRTVFFDVDHTLIPGTSTEWQFIVWLLSHGTISLRNIQRTLRRFVTDPTTLSGAGLRTKKPYFADFPEATFVELARAAFRDRIEKLISSRGRSEITKLREAGARVVLLSAGPTVLTQLVQESVRADDTIGAELAVEHGKLTGDVLHRLPFGPGKIEAALRYAHHHGLSLATCGAYANATSDLPLLRMVGYPIAVNPSRTLRHVAVAEGWPILQFVR